MAYLDNKSQIGYVKEEASLANGAEINSGFIDGQNYVGFQVTVYADAQGLTYMQTLKAETGGSENAQAFPLQSPVETITFTTFGATFRERYVKIQLQNNSGGAITNVKMEIKLLSAAAQPSVFPLSTNPVAQSQAILNQSVIIGLDASGTYRNTAVDEVGALLVGDFGTEVARGLYPAYKVYTQAGRNPSINSADPAVDVWDNGGAYTGFNCTAAEVLETFSDDAADSGDLLSSGTATDGSGTTLVDSGATFVSDGVAVGDLVINDTTVTHGIVESVDSETQVTVLDMRDGTTALTENTSGDAYRIATATSTGAAVVKLDHLLDADYDEYAEYVILDGVTAVDTTGSYLRHSKTKVILSGSSDWNEGVIETRQSVTTANVTESVPAESGESSTACGTVPKGKNWIIKRMYASMARANGSLGSADIKFQIREKGGSWETKRFPTITSGLLFNEQDIGGEVVNEETDVRWRVDDVSDNATIVTAEFEYFEINNI